MIKKIKALMIAFVVASAAFVPMATVSLVGAQTDIQDAVCGGTALDSDTGCSETTGTSTEGVESAVNQAVDILSWIVGIASVIMIIVGGFKYITSGGASDKVTSAKSTIIYAIIGLVIVALAQFIVNFVLETAISVDNGA